MTNPRHIHWVTGKHILRYLPGTADFGIGYASNGGVLLLGYIDFDWGGSIVDRKSTSGYCFNLGSAMISWSSRNQGSVAQSTAESKYITASTAYREVVWLRKLLGGLFSEKIQPTVIRCDNQSCIKLSENPMFHVKLKHIEMKCHFIQDMDQKCIVKLQYIDNDE